MNRDARGRERAAVSFGPHAGSTRPCVQGPSFAPGAKLGATLLVALLALFAWRNADHPALRELSTPVLMLGAMAALLAAAGWWSVLRGRTAIDAHEIRQSGLPPRRVALADIAQLKLVRLRGLEWLVTPRLVVQARGLGTSTFHCADAVVLDAFEQLCYGRAPAARADA